MITGLGVRQQLLLRAAIADAIHLRAARVLHVRLARAVMALRTVQVTHSQCVCVADETILFYVPKSKITDYLLRSDYERVYHILTKYIESKLPEKINKVVDYLTSPGTIVPLLLLLVLIIYWLLSTVANLKDANNDLKLQLRKDKDLILDDGGGPPAEPLPEKKHVRINEEIDTNSVTEKKPLKPNEPLI